MWPAPEVLNQQNNDYVVASLYCDDKEDLPENLKIVSPDGININTCGKKWSQMQIDRYGSNAQPLYVLLDNNEKTLLQPIPYTPDATQYADLLKKGVTEFKKRTGK